LAAFRLFLAYTSESDYEGGNVKPALPKRYLICCVLLPIICSGQFLHDERRAAKSEEALKAAKEVTSGSIFQKQLSNLDILSRSSSARVFEGAERQMHGKLALLSSRWIVVQGIFDQLSAEVREEGTVTQQQITDESARLVAAENAVKAQLDELKKKIAAMPGIDTELAATWLERIGKIGEMEPLAEKARLIQEPSPAQLALFGEITSTLDNLAELYQNFKITLPASPSALLLQAQLDLLKAEETHQKQLGLILARRESELMDLRETLKAVDIDLKCVRRTQPDPTGKCILGGKYASLDIRSSLETAVNAARQAAEKAQAAPTNESRAALSAAEKEVRNLLGLLLNVASLAARGDTPIRLAGLRQAEEERRDSIRQSAASARSYEQFIQNGAERLSLYYQGGIRPDTLARMANALATLGLIPAVAF
jgi:hypothetical protein